MNDVQVIPGAGPGRRALQEKGQFWTPQWVARGMARFVLAAQPDGLLDPAVGAGAFFRAARGLGFAGPLVGFEPDAAALEQAAAAGLSGADLAHTRIGNFLTNPPSAQFRGILANPPYIRHHRIAPPLKAALRADARRRGLTLDGRAGLHVYFFLRCLDALAPGGRLAFIVSADLCEGVFAPRLWGWVAARFRLHAVATFAPQATPFPGVDTNAVIIALEHAPPAASFAWARLLAPSEEALSAALLVHASTPAAAVEVHARPVAEALSTGLSRPPPHPATGRGRERVLGDLARVMRGVATGANDFFFLTREAMRVHGLPAQWFCRAVGRTRDCPGDTLTLADLDALDAAGRPTWLLNLPPAAPEELPAAVQRYLLRGELDGLAQRPLIAARRCWFSVERREPPPILFAYLGRRSCRFIRNRAGAVPLTGFLCVYPRAEMGLDVDHLWSLLNAPEVVERLAWVGKSYGAGAIKVEPRALERLPLPAALFDPHGEPADAVRQLQLMERRGSYRPAPPIAR